VGGSQKLQPKNKFKKPATDSPLLTRLIRNREDDMGNNPTVLRARELRQTANPAEQCLWNALKGKQLSGYKFTRQFPIGPYFADFACRRHFLLIEIDGSQHVANSYDEQRDTFLLNEGYSVYRVPSSVVLRERGVVCESILAALEGRLEDFVEAPDLRFQRSGVLPRRFTRYRPWLPPTPDPSLLGRGKE
jgi:very-short-patch-repair endonuclease